MRKSGWLILIALTLVFALHGISAAEGTEAAAAGGMEDFYGTWRVARTEDADREMADAAAWLAELGLKSAEFEVLEINERPAVRVLLDGQEYGAWYVYPKDGTLYTDDGSGQGGEMVAGLSDDGMIQYALYNRNEPDVVVYCERTSSEKRSITREQSAQQGARAEMNAQLSDLATTDIDGNTVDGSLIAEQKLVMVNIWATYCQPCIGEMTGLGNLSREMAKEGVMILGIVSDCQNGDLSPSAAQLEKARSIVASTGADYPHLLLNEAMIRDFMAQVQAVPTTFFVDGSGQRVGEVYIGSRAEEEWKEIITATLAELEGK